MMATMMSTITVTPHEGDEHAHEGEEEHAMLYNEAEVFCVGNGHVLLRDLC